MSNYWEEMEKKQQGMKDGKIDRPAAGGGITIAEGVHKAKISTVKFTSDDEDGDVVTIEYTIVEGAAKGGVVKDRVVMDSENTAWKRDILVSNLIDMDVPVSLIRKKSGREAVAAAGITVDLKVWYRDNPSGKFPFRNCRIEKILSTFSGSTAPPEDANNDDDGLDDQDGGDKWDKMDRKQLIKWIVADPDRKTRIGAKSSWDEARLRNACRADEELSANVDEDDLDDLDIEEPFSDDE